MQTNIYFDIIVYKYKYIICGDSFLQAHPVSSNFRQPRLLNVFITSVAGAELATVVRGWNHCRNHLA